MVRIPRQRVDGPDSHGGGVYGRQRQQAAYRQTAGLHKRVSRWARLCNALMFDNPIWLMLVAVGCGIIAMAVLTAVVYFI